MAYQLDFVVQSTSALNCEEDLDWAKAHDRQVNTWMHLSLCVDKNTARIDAAVAQRDDVAGIPRSFCVGRYVSRPGSSKWKDPLRSQ